METMKQKLNEEVSQIENIKSSKHETRPAVMSSSLNMEMETVSLKLFSSPKMKTSQIVGFGLGSLI